MKKKIGYMCTSGCDGCKMTFGNEDILDDGMHLATAYVVPQPYNNLTDPRDALCMGTFFCDLYMPYLGPQAKEGCRCEG